jgi:hypothetical protein
MAIDQIWNVVQENKTWFGAGSLFAMGICWGIYKFLGRRGEIKQRQTSGGNSINIQSGRDLHISDSKMTGKREQD